MEDRMTDKKQNPIGSVSPVAGEEGTSAPRAGGPVGDAAAGGQAGAPAEPGTGQALSGLGNILEDLALSPPGEAPLQLVRLGPSDTAVVPFMPNYARVFVHYCEAPEIAAYTRCNGAGCVLCRAGVCRDERHLFPVWSYASGAVAVLAASASLRPNALRPELARAMQKGGRVVMFIARIGANYKVATKPLPDDADFDLAAIEAFSDRLKAGLIDLASVYQQIPNEALATVPAIERMLRLKGELGD